MRKKPDPRTALPTILEVNLRSDPHDTRGQNRRHEVRASKVLPRFTAQHRRGIEQVEPRGAERNATLAEVVRPVPVDVELLMHRVMPGSLRIDPHVDFPP